MSIYHYEAIDNTGKEQTGTIEADSEKAARNQLRLKGLNPLKLRSKKQTQQKKGTSLFEAKLRPAEVVLLTRQLASLLQASLPLIEALKALLEQSEKATIREKLTAIRNEVLAGSSLSNALKSHNESFSDMYTATVAAGENSGKLGDVLTKLADSLEAKQALQQKVTAAFIYPIVVTIVALSVVVALLTYVVPQVVTVFENTNRELPTLTLVMIALSDILRDWGLVMLGCIIAGVFIFNKAYKNPEFKKKVDQKVLKTPLIGNFSRAVNASRLASTLAILIGSGVPILKALEAAKQTLSNQALKLSMLEVYDNVKEGSSLSNALKRSGLFPPLLTHLVSSGENTGKLADMLERAAHGQQLEVERKAMWLTSLLEPVLILVMGLAVLLIVLAVMLPIIEINQLVQ